MTLAFLYRRSVLFAILSIFLCPIVHSQVVINEIHFDPDLKTEWVEFIELYNAGSDSVDLSGWTIQNAVDFTFPAQTNLSAGQYLVVSLDTDAVARKYGISKSGVIGPFAGRLDNNGDRIELHRADGKEEDRVEYGLGFPWPTVGGPIPENSTGTSHSIQLLNPSLDNNLAGSWRSAAPTPSKVNSVQTENIPPHIRQVDCAPQQPVSGQTVLVTAKVTDPDGVSSVKLLYQIVEPGQYISINDSSYNTAWTELPMLDEGGDGDEIAGDFIYSVRVPSDVQKHRRLIRYRISISDAKGNSLTVPYADDPQPNFAYFVYDGVPPWTGSARPGSVDEVTYSSEMLSSVPIYQLISSKEEVENCTWYDRRGDNNYHYRGTLVYDGVVYDHVWFRARGGVWRYSMGKNMWKFNMNRGHGFQGRDNYGRKYKTKWDKVNLGANIQQGDYWHRGEQGMFESVGFKLFNMAGMEASNTNFVHFRIIDESSEDGINNQAHAPMTDEGTQYDGDFWGLYLATEQVDGRFLDEHDLPDGNLYKMENGGGEIRNQSPYGVTDGSDMRSFMNEYRSHPSSAWWKENSDVDRFYNYRSIVEAIHQYDIASGKNYYYYLNPETDRWFQIPWDLDLTWADNMFGQGDDPFKQAGILNNQEINTEYNNRMREVLDLLYNPDQAGQLIDEFASFIYDPEGESFVDADRAMWDYHWVMSSQAAQRGLNNPSKSGQGRFYQVVATQDFPGMLKLMKDYVYTRGDWIDRRIIQNEDDIPNKPTVTALTDDYKVDSLSFEASDFSDPNGANTFAAMEWRLAEVEPFSTPWDPETSTYEPSEPTDPSPGDDFELIFEPFQQWKYFKGTQEPSDPRSAWRQPDFDDSSWSEGQAPIGYGENFINTELNDMRGGYTTIYLRRTFEISDLDSIGTLTAYTLFDDGFNMWINGVYVAGDHVTGEELPFDALAVHREDTDFNPYELPDINEYLVKGTNTIAVQAINQYLDQSSDCFIDVALVYTPKEDEPEPEPEPTPDPEPTHVIRHLSEPLKYEIDAVWESGEIASVQKQITVPADRVTPGKTYRVRVRMKDKSGNWSHWSQPIQFTAEAADGHIAARSNLRVTEIMYNPTDGGDYEFIELHNASTSAPLNLDGYAFTNGISFVFPQETTIPPNGYLVLTRAASDAEKAAFRQYYGLDSTVVLAGPFTGKFANEGEQITLKTSLEGETVLTFDYNNARGWPLPPDGSGHSLVPVNAALGAEADGSLDYGNNWRASAFIGGSPGKEDTQPLPGVRINELMANASDGNDWIELYNGTQNTIHLGDWYLSDDESELKKWALPAVELAAGQYIVFDSQNDFNADGGGFGISRSGERVLLSYLPGAAGVDRVVDSVRFKAQENEWSWGRSPERDAYWVSLLPSNNAENQTANSSVVISEIAYHPAEDENDPFFELESEFVELYNPTDRAVQLWNDNGPWRIDGGVELILPPNLSLDAKQCLVLVTFDPNNSNARNAFVNRYTLSDPAIKIAGPYSGNLSNNGERLALEKLMEVDPTDGSLAWAIVDEVIYFDRAPWTPEADGTSQSLQRVSSFAPGNDPLAWKAGDPTPGEAAGIDTPVSAWMLY